MIDSHTHLHLCEQPDSELVAAAEQAGVSRMLTVGIDSASCRSALASAEAFPQVYAAVGRHPTEVTGFDDEDLAELEALASHERCVAIGETGYDFHHDRSSRADQERAFAAHIDLAKRIGKPLIIHTREADEATLGQLEGVTDLSVVMHCFSMPERLDECLERGYAISFAGNVTYKSATSLAQAAASVPTASLLIETDAPFLTPIPMRKERNQPAYVAHTASFIAELRKEALGELSLAVERNAARIFGW